MWDAWYNKLCACADQQTHMRSTRRRLICLFAFASFMEIISLSYNRNMVERMRVSVIFSQFHFLTSSISRTRFFNSLYFSRRDTWSSVYNGDVLRCQWEIDGMEGGNAGVATYRPGAEARLKWMTVPAVEADAQCLVRSWRKKRERARRDKAERQDKSKPNENETRLAPFSKILIGRSKGCVVATTKSFFTHPRVPVKEGIITDPVSDSPTNAWAHQNYFDRSSQDKNAVKKWIITIIIHRIFYRTISGLHFSGINKFTNMYREKVT